MTHTGFLAIITTSRDKGGNSVSLSKVSLVIVGIILVIMGVMALIPSLAIGSEPMWHAVAKVVIGIIAVIIPFTDK